VGRLGAAADQGIGWGRFGALGHGLDACRLTGPAALRPDRFVKVTGATKGVPCVHYGP